MEWYLIDAQASKQILDNGRNCPTLVVNQGDETVVLSTQSSATIGLDLHPGMAYRCAPNVNLWAKTNTGESIVVLDNTNGEFFETLIPKGEPDSGWVDAIPAPNWSFPPGSWLQFRSIGSVVYFAGIMFSNAAVFGSVGFAPANMWPSQVYTGVSVDALSGVIASFTINNANGNIFLNNATGAATPRYAGFSGSYLKD